MDAQELQTLKNKFDIVGNDPELNRALEMAAAVAGTDLAVLITGESGVGKETIPQIIHQFSRRKTGKYLAVNCGAIPEGTINAELFGNVKGAYTGAVGERKGYFEEANGGTLFLDEIGELPRETQALLLRVLQNGEYMKVGSSKIEKCDVRIIAATNLELQKAVDRGKFREDLYYRLNGIQIKMPPLRERKDDIYLLFRKFTSDYADKFNLRRISLTHEAIALLRGYRWPGNIRQLKNFSEAVITMESEPARPGADRVELDASVIARYLPDEKDTLLPAVGGGSSFQSQALPDEEKKAIVKAILDLKHEVDELRSIVHSGWMNSVPMIDDQKPDEPVSLKKAKDDLIFSVLDKHGGDAKAAAEELGISDRTVYRKKAARKATGNK